MEITILDLCMPRLNSLSAILEELGYEAEIIMRSEEEVPEIQTNIKGLPVRMSYMPTDENRFMLMLVTELGYEEEEEEQFFELYGEWMESCVLVSGIPFVADNMVVVKAALPEVGVLHEKEIYDYFLQEFYEEVVRFSFI